MSIDFWSLIASTWKWLRCNASALEFLASLAALLLLVLVNRWLKRAAEVQYVSTLITAFQNEWHDRTSILMRAALQTDKFKWAFNDAIEKAYGRHIEDNKISLLLDRKNLIGSYSDQDRLERFNSRLMGILFRDPINNGNILFSGYDAVYRVLLSFDRLAVLCDEPQAMKKFITKYRPPLRDFREILQQFIAVRILLREKGDKNYKKHYMQLLRMLGLADPILYKICKIGVMKRGEWTIVDSWRVGRRRFYRWCVEILNKPIFILAHRALFKSIINGMISKTDN